MNLPYLVSVLASTCMTFWLAMGLASYTGRIPAFLLSFSQKEPDEYSISRGRVLC